MVKVLDMDIDMRTPELDIVITERMVSIARSHAVVIQICEEFKLVTDTPSMEDLLQAMETGIANEILNQMRWKDEQ